jgi:LEA14-like dessication related protein
VFAVGVLRFGSPDLRLPPAASPDYLRLGDARLTVVSLTETAGEAKVILFNPCSFVVPIREIAYELWAGDRHLASGALRSVRLRPRQETTVSLPVTARNVDLAAVAGSALMAGGVVDGRLVGHITVKVSTGDVSVPINLPGRIEIGK